MGASASVAKAQEWTAQTVNEQIKQLGTAYETYADILLHNDVDGARLVEMKESDLAGLDLKLEKGHEKQLLAKLEEIKSAVSPPVPTLQKINASYHAFIGYRVSTEKKIVASLLDKLKIKQAENDFPDFKPYVDSECLENGELWAEGFIDGLYNSTMFCPIMSWHGENEGSVGQLLKIDPTGGKDQDWCDNVLLEYQFGLVMRDNFPKQFKITPIFSGPTDATERFTQFPFDKAGSLPDVVSAKTQEQLINHCDRLGINLSAHRRERSIKGTIKDLTDFQGIQLSKFGEEDRAKDELAELILADAKSQMAAAVGSVTCKECAKEGSFKCPWCTKQHCSYHANPNTGGTIGGHSGCDGEKCSTTAVGKCEGNVRKQKCNGCKMVYCDRHWEPCSSFQATGGGHSCSC
jgi:hypothetical protein